MKYVLCGTYVLVAGASFAFAQQREVKLLSQQECAQIKRLSEKEFFVTGPLVMGSITLQEQAVPEGGLMMMGVDLFDVIKRSCYSHR